MFWVEAGEEWWYITVFVKPFVLRVERMQCWYFFAVKPTAMCKSRRKKDSPEVPHNDLELHECLTK